MQTRENELQTWINNILGNIPYTLSLLAGDASFRCYYRIKYNGLTQVIMDAPPEKESIEPFIRINKTLANNGLVTPTIRAINTEQGFLLLDDLGDQLFLNALKTDSSSSLYQTALSTLLTLQKCPVDDPLLPIFDIPFMLKEMGLFQEWFLKAYLSLNLTPDEATLIKQAQNFLAESIMQQPQVFIHRDYHSRNLMIINNTKPHTLGVIDFQDAMRGPITYDLVSVLKDCYVSWPREQVLTWVKDFYSDSAQAKKYTLDAFIEAFDLCGLQRHLKVLGIFSRLYLRDNKPGYLNDLPLTLNYVLECTASYEALRPLHQFLQTRVVLP